MKLHYCKQGWHTQIVLRLQSLVLGVVRVADCFLSGEYYPVIFPV